MRAMLATPSTAHDSAHHASAALPMRRLLLGRPADRLLLFVVLLLIGLLWAQIQARVGAGPVVADIYRGKTLVATYPLPAAGEPTVHLSVQGPLGVSDVVIDQHGARIIESPCPTQRCVLSGAHHHAGDMIACVPNRVLVLLHGRDDVRFDAIAE